LTSEAASKSKIDEKKGMIIVFFDFSISFTKF
jgi:hypothetical protein